MLHHIDKMMGGVYRNQQSINIFLLLAVIIFGSCQNKEHSLTSIISQYEDYQKVSKNHNWPDFSDSTIANDLLVLEEIAGQLQRVVVDKLSPNDKINHATLTLIVEDKIYHLTYGSHLMPLNAEGGFLAGMLYQIRNFNLSDSVSLVNYKNKLRGIPAYLQQQKSLLNKGITEQKVLPKLVVNNCLSLLQNQLSQEQEKLFLYKPMQNLESRAFDSLDQLIKSKVLPAFHGFATFLESDYLPNARNKIGISNIAGGKEYYKQRVRFFTTSQLTPEEIYETGQAEVRRIRSEMEKIIAEVEFEGSFAEFIETLRSDPQFYAKTPQELLDRAAWFSKKAEEILPTYFGKITPLPFTVKPVPSAIAPTYTSGRYSPGSIKNHRPGEYWVNTYKLESRPLYVLPALTLHEAVPGHHLQGALAQEIEEVPEFRRSTYLSAYGEGWGLYSEYLGKEAGIYTTLYEDFGRLTYEMWRACRLVVDPGIHYFGWSKAAAVEFMARNTALSLHEINTEIDRYIGWPGQAVSYKIGELKIKELRRLAEKELEHSFDIREFHDKLLENGSVPLTSLQEIIEEYIETKKNKKS